MRFILIFLIALSPLLANPNSKEAKEMKELSKKVCAKTAECMRKSAAGLPADQKKMVESMIPSMDACVNNHNVAGNSAEPYKKISKADIEAMKNCVNDTMKLTCEQLMEEENQPKSCARFNE